MESSGCDVFRHRQNSVTIKNMSLNKVAHLSGRPLLKDGKEEILRRHRINIDEQKVVVRTEKRRSVSCEVLFSQLVDKGGISRLSASIRRKIQGRIEVIPVPGVSKDQEVIVKPFSNDRDFVVIHPVSINGKILRVQVEASAGSKLSFDIVPIDDDGMPNDPEPLKRA